MKSMLVMVSVGLEVLGFSDSISINHSKIVSSQKTSTMMSTADAVKSFNSFSRLTLWASAMALNEIKSCAWRVARVSTADGGTAYNCKRINLWQNKNKN